MKAMLMVFASSGLLPSSNDVLFCTEKTPQTILEQFVMRALLYESKTKKHAPTVPSTNAYQKTENLNKVFVIANFQKLNIELQNDMFEFMRRQEQAFYGQEKA